METPTSLCLPQMQPCQQPQGIAGGGHSGLEKQPGLTHCSATPLSGPQTPGTAQPHPHWSRPTAQPQWPRPQHVHRDHSRPGALLGWGQAKPAE